MVKDTRYRGGQGWLSFINRHPNGEPQKNEQETLQTVIQVQLNAAITDIMGLTNFMLRRFIANEKKKEINNSKRLGLHICDKQICIALESVIGGCNCS